MVRFCKEVTDLNRNESFPSADTHSIVFDMVRSSIDVQSCDVEDIQLLISGDDESVSLLQLEWNGGRLSMSMPIRDRVPNLVSPAWMQTILRLPRSWKGALEMKSQSGMISINTFSGTDLNASTVSGHIRATNITCITCSLHAMSGILLLESAQVKDIRLSTVTGNIMASSLACERFRCSTVSGSMELSFSEPFQEMSGTSTTGDTHLSVPLSEINASLRSVTGRLLTRNVSIQETGPVLHFTTVTGNLAIVGSMPNLTEPEEA